MFAGLFGCSAPVMILMACSREKYCPFSLLFATTYIVFVAGLIAGVPVIPTVGATSGDPESCQGTAVAPAAAPYAAVRRLICQIGFAFAPPFESASNA